MGSCWCKTKSRPLGEPYLPLPKPQAVSSPSSMAALPTVVVHPPSSDVDVVPPSIIDGPSSSDRDYVVPLPSIIIVPPSVCRTKKIALKMIDQLVLDMLGCISFYVDNNQMPPSLLHLHIIADQEDGWVAVITSAINVTPVENPFGPSLITVLLDDCPLPCKYSVQRLTRLYRLSKERSMAEISDIRVDANMCAVLGCIAERLAGPNSAAVLSDDTLEYLVGFLAYARNPNLILFALFTLEKFALTSANKVRITKKLEKGPEHLLLMLQRRINDEDIAWAQVGFCAQWALDNIFVIEGRKLGYEMVDMTGINTVLNASDTSEYLKISSDGLTARCDSYSFESVRSTFQVDEGCWFYECTILTKGVMQIGWATKNSHFLNYVRRPHHHKEGYGVGDDLFSVSYDGCRKLIWYKATSTMVMGAVAWQPGDVLGCVLDLLEKEMVFLLNGVPLAAHTEIFNVTRSGFFAAASFMTYQQCRFNFGHEPFKFPPTDREFLCFNDFSALDDEERKIIPRRIVNARLQMFNSDEFACILCCDARACCILEPCGHDGFCSTCTLMLKDCPLCRAPIVDVAIVSCLPDVDDSMEPLALPPGPGNHFLDLIVSG